MALTVAVIGLGRMGAEPSVRLEGKIPDGWLPISHVEAVQSTPGLELIALCDQNEELLTRHQQYYNVQQAFCNYKEMIDEVRPDIISIATRTDVRCDIINYALQKGVRGFYAEKPISRSLKDCKAVLNNIASHKAKIVYGATRRAMDIYKKAKQICDSGELGDTKQILIEFGTSSLMWSHPHSVDLIIYFAGSTQIERIQGQCFIEPQVISSSTLVDSDPVVENAHIVFANGISACISQAMGLNVRIGCSKGNLTVHGDGYFIEINRPREMPSYFHSLEKIQIDGAMSGTQYLMQDLRDAVLYDQPVQHIVPEEILCGQQLLFGILQSSFQNGRHVSLAELNDNLVITGRTGKLFA